MSILYAYFTINIHRGHDVICQCYAYIVIDILCWYKASCQRYAAYAYIVIDILCWHEASCQGYIDEYLIQYVYVTKSLGYAYIVIDILCWHEASRQNVVVVAMVDQKHSSEFDEIHEVTQSCLLVELVTVEVRHVGERVAEADDRVETFSRNGVLHFCQIVNQTHPIAFFDNCQKLFYSNIWWLQ